MAFKLRNQNVKRVTGSKHPFAHSASATHGHPHGGASDIPTISQRQTTISQTAPSSDELVYDVVNPDLMQVDASQAAKDAYNALTPEQQRAQDQRFLEINQRRADEADKQTEENRFIALNELRQGGGSETAIDTQQRAISDTSISQQQALQQDYEYNQTQIQEGVKDLVGIDAVKMGNQFAQNYMDNLPFTSQGSEQSQQTSMAYNAAGQYTALVGSGAYTPEQALDYIKKEYGENLTSDQRYSMGQTISRALNEITPARKSFQVFKPYTQEELLATQMPIYKSKRHKKKGKVSEYQDIKPLYAGSNTRDYRSQVMERFNQNK